MRRYRTRVLIPPDRTVVMHLPAHVPEGWAVVTIELPEPENSAPHDADPDHQDIEWWEEFDEDGDEDEGDVEVR